MPTIRTLTAVPTNEKDQVISDFESEGASVEVSSEGNELWKITATFSDATEPDETSDP